MRILSADIGGTRARFQFAEYKDNHLNVLAVKRYASKDYNSILTLIEKFMEAINEPIKSIDVACFAVAGPIVEGQVQLTNLPWGIDEKEVSSAFNIEKVRLINDFSAVGYGIEAIQPENLYKLQKGLPQEHGSKAIIGAGTGLGMAIMHWNGHRYSVLGTEGGHADFAPTDEAQMELLQYLRKKYHRVSTERVLSGRGLVHIYKFVRDNPILNEKENPKLKYEMATHDSAAIISEYASKHKDPLAMRAMSMFVKVYAAQVGNLALMTLPFGGLYIAGGIAPKILVQLTNGIFMEHYGDKGRMSQLLTRIPLSIILDQDVELKGAAMYAAYIYEGV